MVESEFVDSPQSDLSFFAVFNTICTVDFAGYGLNLFFHRKIPIVEWGEITFTRFSSIDYGLCEVFGSFTTFGPTFGFHSFHTYFGTFFNHQIHFFLAIVVETVDGYDRNEIEFADIFNMLGQIGKTFFHSFYAGSVVLFRGCSTVMTQCANRCHNSNSFWFQTGGSAFYVEEFFGSEIGSETGFGY